MAPRFETTRWSLVVAARDLSDGAARAALEELCGAYRPPLLAHVRRKTRSSEQAEDLVQSFFADLLARGDLAGVQPDKGRLRSFLLACLNHFLLKEWERERAAKRGADRTVSLDGASSLDRRFMEPRTEADADAAFEREWALAVVARARAALRSEHESADRLRRFELLEPLLTEDRPARPYREIAAELELSEGAVKTAVHRLRKRFGTLLRAEVAQTVAEPGLVDDELRALLDALARTGP